MTNFEIALKAEMKNVTRCFHAFDSETRANHAASFRLGYRQRQATGQFYYTHPACPNIAFKTRTQAAMAALRVAA